MPSLNNVEIVTEYIDTSEFGATEDEIEAVLKSYSQNVEGLLAALGHECKFCAKSADRYHLDNQGNVRGLLCELGLDAHSLASAWESAL